MKPRILIVDDEEQNIEKLKGILADKYDLEEAYDGKGALVNCDDIDFVIHTF